MLQTDCFAKLCILKTSYLRKYTKDLVKYCCCHAHEGLLKTACVHKILPYGTP